MTPAENVRITGASYSGQNEVIVELSDGRTVTYSLEQLLRLTPVASVTEEEAVRWDAEDV